MSEEDLRSGEGDNMGRIRCTSAAALLCLAAALPAVASSHREAPAILAMPQVDGADFYMFRSYQPGRDGYVTLIATYNPMQDPFGGPNFFPMQAGAFYDIHIDNDGDAVEDLTFRFRFSTALPVVVPGTPGLGVPVPLPNGVFVPVGISNVFPAGPGSPPPNPPLAPLYRERINWIRTYTVRAVRPNPNDGGFLSYPANGAQRFAMPFDYVGTRAFPNYPAYAAQFVYDAEIPGCANGRLFVGQRKEPFAFNLGEFFDLVNIPNPLGDRDAIPSSLANKNITALTLEVPTACLTAGGNGSGVIAGWTTASLPRVRTLVDDPTFDEPYQQSGGFVQVSRLGNPAVNEIDIALKDKNLFNASHPRDDEQFEVYFTTPTVPVGIQLVTTLFPPGGGGPVPPPTVPRNDLKAFFLEGLANLNQDNSGGEVLRLNTTTPPVAAALQNNLGLLGGDIAGWPNGRRPGDDVIDITMRVLEGALCYLPPGPGFGLCAPADAPAGGLPFTDQTWVDANDFDTVFPYLTTPIPGSTGGL
jgi:hypothetical protein